MAYEMVMPYHLHMPSYFLETFTEYPYVLTVKILALTYTLMPSLCFEVSFYITCLLSVMYIFYRLFVFDAK